MNSSLPSMVEEESTHPPAPRRKDRQVWLRQTGVPARFHDQLLDGPLHPTKALELVSQLVAGNGNLLVLAGRPGCGKSFAAGKALLELGGYFVSAHDLARPLPEVGGRGQDLMRAWKDAPCLVLDDVGDEHSPSGYAAATVRELVRQREHEALPLVMTTNLQRDAFLERYGERVASRLAGDSLGFRVCKDPDLRLQSSHGESTHALYVERRRLETQDGRIEIPVLPPWKR